MQLAKIQARLGVLRGSYRHETLQAAFSTSAAAADGRQSAAIAQHATTHADTTKKKAVKLDLNPVRGTRDFFPEDHRLKDYLFGAWRSTAKAYGFEEYDAPVVESESLYVRKAGEDITQQLYNFTDKGGRRLALRPEMTPSLARMVLSKKNSLPLPLKWFSVPQCWRYERMTRGRRREHYQWNMDIWGVSTVHAEAELLAAAVHNMRVLGLGSADVGVKISSRKILTALMTKHGVPEAAWARVCVCLDKLDKKAPEAVIAEMTKAGCVVDDNGDGVGADRDSGRDSDDEDGGRTVAITTAQARSLVTEVQSVSDLDSFAVLLGEDCEGIQDIRKVFQLAEAYGYADWLVFDPCIVRGLAYYTGIVFEGFDRKGELRALFGGGRYDTLLQTMAGGGDDTGKGDGNSQKNGSLPAVGFGFGDAVIVEMLKSRVLLPDFAGNSVQVVVHARDGDMTAHLQAVKTANKLRLAGVTVDLILDQGKKLKWVMSHADKIAAQAVVLISGAGKVNVKNMATGHQEDYGADTAQSTVVSAVGVILSTDC
jgi:histidyl-tRNA synthetase